MDLTKHYEEFRDSIVHAFSQDELEMMVRLDLGQTLDNVVPMGGTHPKRVFDLIDWADKDGRVDELFAAAVKRRPRNPKLEALAAKLAQEAQSDQEKLIADITPLINQDYENSNADKIRSTLAARPASDRLEALAVKSVSLGVGQAAENWQDKMQEASSRISSIAYESQHKGTGFLIGEDLLITNSHVVKANQPIDKFDAVFDFQGTASRDDLTKYELVEEIARSEPREYDFAIFRLNRVPDGGRGYFKANDHQFQIREPVSILGHPSGDSLRFSFGVIYDSNSYLGRIAYTANTAPGSSGSPVFAENWDLVGIHHHGEENINNHGIPMQAIGKHLKDNGKDQLIQFN